MSVIYLTKQGTYVTKERGRMVISDNQFELFSTPWAKIESVVVFGNIQLTTQVISALLEHDIPTTFLTMEGILKGQLITFRSKNTPLKLAQFKAAIDDGISMEIAKAIVIKKINNQLNIIKDFKSNHPEADFFDEEYLLNDTLSKVENMYVAGSNGAQTPEYNKQTLLGYEGIASKSYFSALRKIFIGELKFDGRNKRPPKDEVNSLLSFGYTLLGIKISAILHSKGLETGIGFFHSVEYGRESLMLDILEIFRQPAVDKLVINMCNKNMLKKEDFEPREGGIYLKVDKMEKFIKEFENWVGVLKESSQTFYQKIITQCNELVSALENNKAFHTI
jgi:CRISPR-associated protein Cas1